jgi:ABC-type nitrate/sulfonate/bicarbonate transport system permease component
MKKSTIITYLFAVFLIIALWEILALILDSPVLPTPADVIASCAKVMQTSEFWQHFGQSGIRVLISVIISLISLSLSASFSAITPKPIRFYPPFCF